MCACVGVDVVVGGLQGWVGGVEGQERVIGCCVYDVCLWDLAARILRRCLRLYAGVKVDGDWSGWCVRGA
jgi:hypothetical protein